MLKNLKSKAINDLFWYSIGTFVPILISIIRTPIFTRYFSPEEYGYYGLIFITYSVFSIFLYSWLNNCVWRFYNFYKKESRLNEFYSNLGLLYLLFTIVFIIITIVWSATSSELIIKQLTVLIFLQLFISSPINYIIIIYRLELRSERYNIIQISRTLLSFVVQYYLTFGLHFRIETIPISSIIIDLIILVVVLPPFFKKGLLKLKNYSIAVIKKIFGYALPGIISNLTFLILVSSDRYMIAYFGTINEVGIYNQVYNLSQVSIMALINVFFSVINPTFLREMEHNFAETTKHTQNYIVVFIILLLPVTTCLSLFASQLALILFGKEFQSGYDIIPWIMFSTFIYGLSMFNESRLKMSSHYNPIIIGFFITSGLNIVLNIIFLPILNYKFAAISTLISYAFLFVYLLKLDIKLNSFSISGLRKIIPALALTILQVVFVLFVQAKFNLKDNISWMFIELAVFCLIYIPVLYFFNKSDIRKLLDTVSL